MSWFFLKMYSLDFCDFEAPIMNICNTSGCFYSCSSEKQLSFKAFLCSSLWSLSSGTLQSVMGTQSFLLKVSTFCYLPSSKALGGSRTYPPVPGGAERGTGGGCCLVQVASWMERKDAGEGVTSWWENENAYFVCLSFSGSRITSDCTEGQGRSGSKRNRDRMINSWRQARKTEMLKQGEIKLKLFIYRYSLISSWLCDGFFVCLFCCFSPAETELALLPVRSEVSHAPTHPQALTLSCSLPRAAALV